MRTSFICLLLAAWLLALALIPPSQLSKALLGSAAGLVTGILIGWLDSRARR